MSQFDNDTRFQGPHQHRDVVSRVMRLCLSLGVTPVFAPVREHGFQNAIENLNGRWQAKVWSRFHHESLAALCAPVGALRPRGAGAAGCPPDGRAATPGDSANLAAGSAGDTDGTPHFPPTHQ